MHAEFQSVVWAELLKACSLSLAICAGSKPSVTLGGIKPHHTYTILNCGDVPSGGQIHQIMRLRNPWGDTEYKGYASEDDTKFWSQAPAECRKKLMPEPNCNDGDFAIPFNEFIKHFESIDVSVAQPNFSYEF